MLESTKSPSASHASGAAALNDIIPTQTLQALQDRFAHLGQMTVCICDQDGSALTTPTWGSHYSQLIGTTPKGKRAFKQGLRACCTTPPPPTSPTCHDGMTLYPAAITHHDQPLAFIVVGTRDPQAPPGPEARSIARRWGVDPEALVASSPPEHRWTGGTPDDIRRFADVLANTIATLYAQSARITRQLADLRIVHGVSELLAGKLDLQQILDRTVRQVVEVMAVKACGIRLLNVDTGELVIRAVHNLSDEYLSKGAVMLRDNAIDSAAFAGETVTVDDAATDPRIRYPDNARREGIVSGLCAPMTYRGQTIGVIRVYTGQPHHFSESEQQLLRSIGSQTAAAIIHARLHEDHAEAERFQRQVRAAGEIQRRMLARRPPPLGRVTFGCVYDPTLDVGGDFYDFIELDNDRLGLCVADVVGKGIPAALMMASVRSALRSYADRFDDIRETMSNVNRHMCRDTLVGEFTTLVYGVFSHDGSHFTYCNAGHVPPVLLRGDDIATLTAGGLVIGVMPDETFDRDEIDLQPGDVLVLVTDGVIEAMDYQGVMYGSERLYESIRKHRALDAQQLAGQLLWDVRRFVGLADQSDDITIVVAKI